MTQAPVGSPLDTAEAIEVRDSDSTKTRMSDLSNEALMREVLGLEDPKDRTEQTRREPKKLMYFRLCDRTRCTVHSQSDGWVTMGVASGVITAQEHTEFIEAKHATPLHEYGRHDLDAVKDPTTRYAPLINEGGITELPLSQMRAFGWHHIDAVVALVPELEETKEWYCENGCPKSGKKARWFLSEDLLRKHTEALHRDAAAPAAVGRSVVEALKELPSMQQLDPAALVAAVIAGIKVADEMKLTEVDEPEETEEEVPVEEETPESDEPEESSDAAQALLDSMKEGD
jgi:hypothetical protein